MKRSLILFSLIAVSITGFGQTQQDRAQDVQLNAITTAVPFLNIAPDSRSGAMGDVGVALAPDGNSIHWNPSKLAFVENDVELSLSYSPWLRSLVPDMNIAYLTGYKRINKISTVGASLRYFSLGEITFTDDQGNILRNFKPVEWAIDGAYALKLSENLSAGVALRYIRSNLTGGSVVQGVDNKPGQSVAFDVSAFYKSRKFDIQERDAHVNVGLNISNIGNKMSYTSSADEDFIPANLRLGTALKVDVDDFNAVTLSADLNKLLVPTPGGDLDDTTSADKKVTPLQGVFGSFSDAPGGSSEELREWNIGVGFEYLYAKQLAFRAGYFYEHESKGNRKFITLGAGLKYTVFNVDLSYLIATNQASPLANTLRITLRWSLDNTGSVSADGGPGKI